MGWLDASIKRRKKTAKTAFFKSYGDSKEDLEKALKENELVIAAVHGSLYGYRYKYSEISGYKGRKEPRLNRIWDKISSKAYRTSASVLKEITQSWNKSYKKLQDWAIGGTKNTRSWRKSVVKAQLLSFQHLKNNPKSPELNFHYRLMLNGVPYALGKNPINNSALSLDGSYRAKTVVLMTCFAGVYDDNYSSSGVSFVRGHNKKERISGLTSVKLTVKYLENFLK